MIPDTPAAKNCKLKEGFPIPSSNRTPFLQLNKWLGSDKPKKDDFNSDNQKLDDAYRMLSQSVEQLEYQQQNNSYASAQALSAHTGNSGIHVTAAEKLAWSGGAGFSVGYYTGNGASSQSVSLGFQPRFGLIFASGDGIVRVSWAGEQLQTNCGCISQLGCSQGLSLTSNGFTATHSASGGTDGFSLKFNTLNVRYIYFIWK